MTAALTLIFLGLIVAITQGQAPLGEKCCQKDWKELIGPVTESYSQNRNDLSAAAFQTAFAAWEAKKFDYLYPNQNRPEGICKGRLSYKCERDTCECVDLPPAFKYVNETNDCVGVDGAFCLEDGSVGCQEGFKCVVNEGQANGRFRLCVVDQGYVRTTPWSWETWGQDRDPRDYEDEPRETITKKPFHAEKRMAARDLTDCLGRFHLPLNVSCDAEAHHLNNLRLDEVYGIDDLRDNDWYAKAPLEEWKKHASLACQGPALDCVPFSEENPEGICECTPPIVEEYPCDIPSGIAGTDPATLCLNEYAKVLALARNGTNAGRTSVNTDVRLGLFAIGILGCGCANRIASSATLLFF